MNTRRLTIQVAVDLHLIADQAGPPDGMPIVLLHGGGQTKRSWSSTQRRLANIGWNVVAVDLRGHGESDWASDGDYSLRAMAGDVGALVGLFTAPPVIVGASVGGLAAMQAVAEGPSGFARALVLVDTGPLLESEGVDRVVSFMGANPDGFESVEAASAAIAAYRGRPPSGPLASLEGHLRLGSDGRYRWHWDPALLLTAPGMGPNAAELSSERLSHLARSLRLPTLLVRGRESDVVSSTDAERFRDLVPHASLAEIDGAGHMVVGDRNDAFEVALMGFLASLERTLG